jgi:two-component system response regulator GlrR
MSTKTLTQIQISRTKGARVLVVDDNADLLKLISMRLKPMKLELKTSQSAMEALSLMASWVPDIIITDLQMPDCDGMEFFKIVHRQNPLLPVIILTAHGTIPDAVEATQSGVASFLSKPFNGDSLINELQQILQANGYLEKHNIEVSSAPNFADLELHSTYSKSPKMAALMRQIERLAPSDAIILFEGEPGTGKDELARIAYKLSSRANHAFMHISCSSREEKLLGAELFGKIGSGTIETPEQDGVFQQTKAGTLLLSDFNEASPEIIFRVLTALVSRRATPVDSEQEYDIDTRILCTTSIINRYGRDGHSSWDFWDKLDNSVLSVPALRERREDIPLIAQRCLSLIHENRELSFANKAMQLMLSADWPGNMRQLISVVRECARLCKTKIISESLLNSRLSNPVFEIQPLSNAHREFERNYLIEVLKASLGNVTKASQMAKRNRTEFHRLLKKHKINAKSFRV